MNPPTESESNDSRGRWLRLPRGFKKVLDFFRGTNSKDSRHKWRGVPWGFKRIFKFMDRGSEAVPIENIFSHSLELVEQERQIRFRESAGTGFMTRFMPWFRWLFFVLACGMGIFVHRSMGGDSWIERLFGMVFLGGALLIGITGAFVIMPMIRRSIEYSQKALNLGERLPRFDLNESLLLFPASNDTVRFEELAGFGLGEGTNGWIQLQARTRDQRRLFLANYPRRETKKATQHGKFLANRTGLSWMEQR